MPQGGGGEGRERERRDRLCIASESRETGEKPFASRSTEKWKKKIDENVTIGGGCDCVIIPHRMIVPDDRIRLFKAVFLPFLSVVAVFLRSLLPNCALCFFCFPIFSFSPQFHLIIVLFRASISDRWPHSFTCSISTICRTTVPCAEAVRIFSFVGSVACLRSRFCNNCSVFSPSQQRWWRRRRHCTSCSAATAARARATTAVWQRQVFANSVYCVLQASVY